LSPSPTSWFSRHLPMNGRLGEASLPILLPAPASPDTFPGTDVSARRPYQTFCHLLLLQTPSLAWLGGDKGATFRNGAPAEQRPPAEGWVLWSKKLTYRRGLSALSRCCARGRAHSAFVVYPTVSSVIPVRQRGCQAPYANPDAVSKSKWEHCHRRPEAECTGNYRSAIRRGRLSFQH